METSVELDFLGDLRRTHMCGDLRAAHAGQTVLLMGWVHRRRDHGGGDFHRSARPRPAITQAIFHEDVDPAVHKRAEEVRAEYVIAVEGMVALRSKETINPNMPTGEVEVVASKIWILNESHTPPFPMEEHVEVAEDVRLKYRYVDLRRPQMQRNIILRSKIAFAVRQQLTKLGFLEIETPFMTRSTPEGARDYLVPSRVQPGTFYALPQSPQIFKQLLMISGFEKYFQIVRCFRDEDLRADRQPEFTQIDIEMSLPAAVAPSSRLSSRWCRKSARWPDTKWPRPSRASPTRRRCENYGIDKPDMRIPPMHPVQDLLPELANAGLPLVAIHIPACGAPSRKERDEFKAFGQERGLRVFDDPKRLDRDYPEQMAKVRERCGAREDSLLVLAAWAGEPKGHRPDGDRVSGLRAVAPVLRQQV